MPASLGARSRRYQEDPYPVGRKASHRIVKQHPSPRFCNTVRLLQFVRGPNDTNWYAQFLIDGVWMPPNNPASLSTKNWDEACENARDKYTLVVNGALPTQPRKLPPQHAFKQYADRAVAELRQQAMNADALVRGKGHNFRCIARLIDGVLTPKWGDMQISAITEHMLNDWVQDDYRVEDAAATVAAHGRQSKESTRNIIYKRPAATTLPTRATRDGISQPAKLPSRCATACYKTPASSKSRGLSFSKSKQSTMMTMTTMTKASPTRYHPNMTERCTLFD